MPGAHQAISLGLFLAICSAYLLMAAYYPMAYLWATYEDLVGEWAQWYLFLAVFILSIRLYRSSVYRPFFAVLGIACFYVMMEEISWGQRIFGFSSPEFFQTYNLQRETNIHNFFVGPYKTPTKEFTRYCLAASLVLYGLVYPWARKAKWRLPRWLESKIPTPPLYLWPYFVTAAVLELGLFQFNEEEVAELLLGTALAITALHYHRHAIASKTSDFSDRRVSSKRFAVQIGILSIAVLVLSTLTTTIAYAVPHIRAETDKRIRYGVEKFAARYMVYEQWPTAAQLYSKLHQAQPNRPSVLRKLANAYRQMGEMEQFERAIEKAIAVDKVRYKGNPTSVPVHESLARSYALLGQTAKAKDHLTKALQLALAQVRAMPNSARAAYWLGKVYNLGNRRELATQQYRRAYRLEPTSSRYRKAAFGG